MAEAARADRRQAEQDFRRRRIREAAAAVFREAGLDGANIRAIATRAGYTPGALYHHYAGKEEIYADLLADSLARLYQAVRQAGAAAEAPRARARASLLAFFDYYRAHGDELELGLYLYRGAAPRGLTPELDRQLNGRLIRVLSLMAEALAAGAGLPPEEANLDTVDFTAHMAGLLILERTGRLKVLGYDAGTLAARRADALLAGAPSSAEQE